MRDKPTQQAWREKVALVFIALLLGGFVGFITMGLNKVFCPASQANLPDQIIELGKDSDPAFGIMGAEFLVGEGAKLPGVELVGFNMYDKASKESGYDISPFFTRDQATYFPQCVGKTGLYATSNTCAATGTQNKCPMRDLNPKTLSSFHLTARNRKIGYTWDSLAANFTKMMVIDGFVLNMDPYLNANPIADTSDDVDTAIRRVFAQDQAGGRDATRLFYAKSSLKEAVPCLQQRYLAGYIDKVTPGCFVSSLILYLSLIIILSLVLIRFVMALWFSWFMSWRLSATPSDYGTDAMSHSRMPTDAVRTVDDEGAAPWAHKKQIEAAKPIRMNHDAPAPSVSKHTIGNEPYVVCLITAYSEGEEGISNTLSSLAETDYPDSRKMLFLVADGMVTGSGEAQSTPDICVSLLEADARFGTPMPMSFISVAHGAKQHNMAMVYAGHYTRSKGRRTPMIVVVKCGTPEEANEKKPGNRGKRDSQMILMNFFQRVTYNDRMTPLDFDLFRKVHSLMGATPDFFELCLMVDADTKVYPKGMRALVNAMMRDHRIMGACGETRIANKRASWVTAIQVYEYFISHHMVKAFESVFGGVTCLPGCFSMYRIKARKPQDNDWVPIIVKPEVTREYSQSVVTTLHQKNLLLLGEDRFLTTMLLRTFPNRKMVFVPQARCRTEVPHTFKMLLSQRRRWINSTVHNLMELVLVRDLCGTFCFSMKFVVFMDLIGTAVLPIAICLTYALIVAYVLNPPKSFTEAIPLMLLIAVIGLPAVLILLATRKVVYTAWMLIYLIFLPVWNFALPAYSFWHFDDFSWGETRKVEGEGKDKGHLDGVGVFAAASVPLRRWQDWERSRLKRQAREEKRRNDLEKQFGAGFYNDQADDDTMLHSNIIPPLPPHAPFARSFNPLQRPTDSDAHSDISSSNDDEDMWGPHIGAFNEEAPPPLAIVRHSIWVDGREEVVDQDDMEKMLSQGWADDKNLHSTMTTTAVGGPRPPLPPSAANARRSMRLANTQQGPPIYNAGHSRPRRDVSDMPQKPAGWTRGVSFGPSPPQAPQRLGSAQGAYSNNNGNGNGSPFTGGRPLNGGLYAGSPGPPPLSPASYFDRTPSPAHGEDVMLLRGAPGSNSQVHLPPQRNGSYAPDCDQRGEHGSSSAVGVGPAMAGQQSHTRNRSSGTHPFTGGPPNADHPLSNGGPYGTQGRFGGR